MRWLPISRLISPPHVSRVWSSWGGPMAQGLPCPGERVPFRLVHTLRSLAPRVAGHMLALETQGSGPPPGCPSLRAGPLLHPSAGTNSLQPRPARRPALDSSGFCHCLFSLSFTHTCTQAHTLTHPYSLPGRSILRPFLEKQ